MSTSPLLSAIDRMPGRAVALVDETGSHPWNAVREAAARVTGTLSARIAPGARVGLLVAPGLRWLTALIGIWRAGAVAVPLSPAHPRPEVEALLDEAGAATLVVDPELAPEGLTVEPVEAGAAMRGPPAAPSRDTGAVAMLLFTSGTTGRPKGAMLTDACLAHQAALLRQAWRLDRDTHLLHALPLHHMHGIAIALWPVLLAGGRATMLPRFDAGRIWAALEEADTFMAVPTMYRRLLDAFEAETAAKDARRRQARRARLFTSGSAALPVDLAERWQAIAGAIPLERYGMTEIGVGCSNPFDPDLRRRGTVGPPLPTVGLRMVDDAQRPTEEGEIQVRGPSLFAGYHGRPEATAEAFSEDGWFRTGDVARREQGGYVRILGRRSVDIIKSGGYKLSALEIEEVLRRHPEVAEIAVVGVADPDWGERAAAVVVPAPGCDPDPKGLRAWAKERLAAYKVPRSWSMRPSLPRNALGKVQKPELSRALSGSY